MIALLFATILPFSMVMLIFADLQPPGLWLFCNIHYFKWVLPIFGTGLILGWQQMRTARERNMLAVVFVVLLLPVGIRIDPEVVSDATPARMLAFIGDTHRAWSEAYFSPVTIIDDRGRLTNVGDFHQIPDTYGERAIATSRMFSSNPHRSDPGEAATVQDQAPYRRYGARLSYLGF